MDATLIANLVILAATVTVSFVFFIPAFRHQDGGLRKYFDDAMTKKDADITELKNRFERSEREREKEQREFEQYRAKSEREIELLKVDNARKDDEIKNLRGQIAALFDVLKTASPETARAKLLADSFAKTDLARKKSVLIISSNPRGAQLDTDVEAREVQDALRRSGYVIYSVQAVRARDITQAVLDYKPDILHFSGHGVDGEIILEDANRKPKAVSLDAIARLLKAQPVDGMVVNACFSAQNINVLLTACNWAIGMKQEINDPSAIAFSIGFYAALADGKGARDAFEIGSASAGMDSLEQMDIPTFVEARKNG